MTTKHCACMLCCFFWGVKMFQRFKLLILFRGFSYFSFARCLLIQYFYFMPLPRHRMNLVYAWFWIYFPETHSRACKQSKNFHKSTNEVPFFGKCIFLSDFSETKICSSEDFTCRSINGECIPLAWMCDGNKDCNDGSDEASCSEYSNVFITLFDKWDLSERESHAKCKEMQS